MKAGIFAVAAAIASGVDARESHFQKRQESFNERGLMASGTASAVSCGCTTIYSTVTGEAQLSFPTGSSSAEGIASSPSAATVAPISSETSIVAPTPLATTCPTPGVYTIPASTLTLTESATICGATSTSLPSAGTYTVGGITTIVPAPTTVTVPYAAISTSSGAAVSTILTTTYVCSESGTYTIAPITTTVTESTDCIYPTAASYAPGTYTQSEFVTTVTGTNVVVLVPYTTGEADVTSTVTFSSTSHLAAYTNTLAPVAAEISSSAIVAPAVSSWSSAWTSTYGAAASSSAAYVAPASVASAVATVVSSVASSSSTTSSSSGNGGSIGSSGNQWAITYSPYQDSGDCKTAEQVAVDIALIAARGFVAVRIYSTDCSGLANIGAAAKISGLKIIVGIFISSTGTAGAADQVTELISWGEWDLVELIVIGNEAIFAGYTTGSELAAFITSSRSSFEAAGFTGQITLTEPLDIWQENADVLCAVVDLTGANLHPFFNAATTAENAGTFALSQLELADAICPGKTAVNLECGWPWGGSCNGAACPGVAEQATAVASIIATAGNRTAIFSYTNDLWKQPGDFDCEQSWGSINLFS